MLRQDTNCLKPWDTALHSSAHLSPPKFSSTHSTLVSCSTSPFPFMGVTTPPTANSRVTLAKIRVTLHPAGDSHSGPTPQHPQQELWLSPQSTHSHQGGRGSSPGSLQQQSQFKRFLPHPVSPSHTSSPIRFAPYHSTGNSWDQLLPAFIQGMIHSSLRQRSPQGHQLPRH